MSESLRIAHVLYSFDTGGMEKGIAMLANHASPEFEHVVVCMGHSGASARLLPGTTRVVELNKRSGHSHRFLWRLSRCLRDLSPDVVHTRNWTGMDGIVASRLGGIKNVVHGEHGWGMDDPYGSGTKRVVTRRFLARWVREYTCVSQQMTTWLRDLVRIRKPITQIYNGVDETTYQPGPGDESLRREIGLPDGSLVIGTVGRLDPIKDYPSLLRAFTVLRRDRPDSHLVIVGEGAERSALEQLAGEGTHFLGDRQDVPSLFRLFDVFVLPSINEGISNTILEAMASGRPVVATRVGGNLELVQDGETGRLVHPRSPDELASAIADYLSDAELRQRHGDAARSLVLRRFSISSMVAGYEEVYRRVAAVQ